MAKKRLTPQDRMALEGWNELVASIPGKLGHQPGGFHRRDRDQKKTAGGGRRGMVPLLLRAVLHLQSRRLPQEGDTAYDGA